MNALHSFFTGTIISLTGQQGRGGIGISLALGATAPTIRIEAFFYARNPTIMAGCVGASSDAPVPKARYANPIQSVSHLIGIRRDGFQLCFRSVS